MSADGGPDWWYRMRLPGGGRSRLQDAIDQQRANRENDFRLDSASPLTQWCQASVSLAASAIAFRRCELWVSWRLNRDDSHELPAND